MADPDTIDATLSRYYEAWTRNDPDLYRTVWADGATFADPPSDDDPPPLGTDAIVAAMSGVQDRATSITYHEQYRWRCGHSVAVHSLVHMAFPDDSLAEVPLVHVFRLDQAGLIQKLEAFLDFSLIRMVRGERPEWMNGPAH
jgi:hypothetical protein